MREEERSFIKDRNWRKLIGGLSLIACGFNTQALEVGKLEIDYSEEVHSVMELDRAIQRMLESQRPLDAAVIQCSDGEWIHFPRAFMYVHVSVRLFQIGELLNQCFPEGIPFHRR